MSTTVSGTLYGDTIKLDKPLNMASGQKVEIVLRPVLEQATWGEGLKRCAGALADFPEMDTVLDEIYQSRRKATYRDAGK